MNQTLKITLAKLCQKTQLPWVDMLPLTLLWAQCTPRSSGYSPFEILYRRMPPVIGKLNGDLQQLADLEMSRHLQALGKVFYLITQETLERTLIPLGNWVHQPWDEVWVKDWKKEPLQPVWTGSLWKSWWPLLLLKLQVSPLDHHIRVKTAAWQRHLEGSSRPQEPFQSLDPKATALTYKGLRALL